MFNKSENFSIPGAVSCESVLLKVFLNSIMLFLLTVYEKIRCRCPCTCHPFKFQATPMQLVGLGRVGLQAIWDEKSQSSDKNF